MQTNFREHTAINCLFLLIAGPAFFYILGQEHLWTTAAFVCSYIFGTLYSPDMDIAENRKYITSAGKRNPLLLLYRLSYMPWWGYGKLFAHRGISHIPILGTLTRVSYVLAIVAIVALMINPQGELLGDLYYSAAAHPQVLLAILMGWSLADISHILLDHFGSYFTIGNVIATLCFIAALGFGIFYPD